MLYYKSTKAKEKNIMAKKCKISDSTCIPSVFFVLSVVAAILFRACRSNWVFIGTSVGFNPLPTVLIILMAFCAALFGILLTLRLYGNGFCKKTIYKVILVISAILSAFLFIFALAYAIGLSMSESKAVFFLHLKAALSEGALLLTVPFFALFFPKLPCKVKKAVAVISVTAVLLSGINAFYPLTAYKITSTPMVIDNGKEYSVVFSTNDNGTGYVEYTFDGKEYKALDNTGGRLNEGRIHSVSIPYEHLRNNSYKVGSTRVIESFSYGSRTGATATSLEYDFKYNDSENQTWLVISDWHTYLDRAYSAINNLASDYDGVILLGDATPGVDFEEQVITNIVEFGGKVSDGIKPVLYARGNHETRGPYADDLPTVLGLEQLYYTADIGPYSFVVLDSGEDKDDSHIEYGGMTDYNTYRADMIEWLKGVEATNEKVIALSHAWQISSVEPELSDAGWAELGRLGTRLLLSGHEHNCRFLGENEGTEKEYTEKYDIIGYIDGGKVGEAYVATLLTLNKDGFDIYSIDNNGEIFADESFEW